MPDPINSQEEGWLNDLRRLFQERQGRYGAAYIFAIASGVASTPKLAHGVVTFGRNEAKWTDETYRYPQYLLLRKRISPD
jgi:hypothetical protein